LIYFRQRQATATTFDMSARTIIFRRSPPLPLRLTCLHVVTLFIIYHYAAIILFDIFALLFITDYFDFERRHDVAITRFAASATPAPR